MSGVPMRASLAASLAFVMSPVAATPKADSCKSLANRLLAEKLTTDTVIAEDAQGCVVTNLKIGGKYRGWTIDRLTVAGPDFRRLKKEHVPSALRVDAHGIRFAPDIDNSHAKYLMRIQQRPFDARLDYAWDRATQQLHLRELAIASPTAGRVALSIDADLPDLDKLKGPEPKGVGIRHARIVLDNGGLFENMMMSAIVGAIPMDKDPAVEIPKGKEKELAQIRRLPSSVIDESSRDALMRFVNDFPHPTGHFEIDQTFDKPLQLDGLKALLAGPAPTWGQGFHLQVRYDPSAAFVAAPAVAASRPSGGG